MVEMFPSQGSRNYDKITNSIVQIDSGRGTENLLKTKCLCYF